MRRLQSSEASIDARLASLASRGLLSSRSDADGRTWYRYAPEPATREVIDRLEALYRERRLAVINQIYTTPTDIQGLADAFLVRKPPKRE
jgi:hypothetical protein